MTRSYALEKLLEHGPMTHAEILECTRWSKRQVCYLTYILRMRGVIRLVEWRRDHSGRHRVYGLVGA